MASAAHETTQRLLDRPDGKPDSLDMVQERVQERGGRRWINLGLCHGSNDALPPSQPINPRLTVHYCIPDCGCVTARTGRDQLRHRLRKAGGDTIGKLLDDSERPLVKGNGVASNRVRVDLF